MGVSWLLGRPHTPTCTRHGALCRGFVPSHSTCILGSGAGTTLERFMVTCLWPTWELWWEVWTNGPAGLSNNPAHVRGWRQRPSVGRGACWGAPGMMEALCGLTEGRDQLENLGRLQATIGGGRGYRIIFVILLMCKTSP